MQARQHYSLPHPQIIFDYLALYTEERKPRRNSTTNSIKYGFEKFAYYACVASEPADDQLDKIVKEMQAEIVTAKTFEDWYKLIFKLRENAEKAQTLKYGGDESLLRQTLHAVANLIICELEKCEFDKDTDDYKLYTTVLYKKITELQNLERKKKEYIQHCLNVRQGKNVDDANKAYNEVILELALLGITDSVNTARQHQLLKDYSLPQPTETEEFSCSDSANYGMPLVLQRKQCEWLYINKFQQLQSVRVSFFDFKKRALLKAEMDAKRKQEQINTSSDSIVQTDSSRLNGSKPGLFTDKSMDNDKQSNEQETVLSDNLNQKQGMNSNV